MKIISWNLAGRTKNADKQADALTFRNPDIIGLQEVTEASWCVLQDKLSTEGFAHNIYSRHLIPSSRKLKAVAIFSRWPLVVLEGHFKVPYPELTLSIKLQTPSRSMEFHCVHIPNGSSHKWEKIDSFEAIYSKLAHATTVPRILCGDFNSPKEELENGNIIPWRPGNSRWANGELSVISGLAQFNLKDVYRELNGYPPKDFSWYSRPHIGRRFDHVFASDDLSAIECKYVHEWRIKKLSDHSAIEVIFLPEAVIQP